MANIAIIGAGWAGLSAALALQRLGHAITLFERASESHGAGGRASTAYPAGEKAPFAIDNGQHVLLGAYTQTLGQFNALGIDTQSAFLRLPAAWHVPHYLNLAIQPSFDSEHAKHWTNHGVFKQLPMALALFKACPASQWPALAAAALRLQWSRPHDYETVTHWLARLRFPAALNTHLWQPLCYATLNTPPDTASAQVFHRVIKDGLLAGSQAAAMLVPKGDLGMLYPLAALKQLSNAGALVHAGTTVVSLDTNHDSVTVNTRGASHHFDAAICATTAKDAARLLPPALISEDLHAMGQQACEPITTIHLNLGQAFNKLDKAVLVLPEPAEPDHPIQHAVLIDRAHLNPQQAGWLTVVLSCSHAALGLPHNVLIQAALNRIRDCLPAHPWANTWSPPCEGIVIHAKQATFACTAGLNRPSMHTSNLRVMLAGDYVTGPYPATLEGAVRSGLGAAQALHANVNKPV